MGTECGDVQAAADSGRDLGAGGKRAHDRVSPAGMEGSPLAARRKDRREEGALHPMEESGSLEGGIWTGSLGCVEAGV